MICGKRSWRRSDFLSLLFRKVSFSNITLHLIAARLVDCVAEAHGRAAIGERRR